MNRFSHPSLSAGKTRSKGYRSDLWNCLRYAVAPQTRSRRSRAQPGERYCRI